MSWTRPIVKATTWLNDRAKKPHSGFQPDPELPAKKQEAAELSEIHTRAEIARIMGVSRSSITKWLGKKK